MAISFTALWDNPSSDPYVDKNGKVPAGYSNQCAIRLGTALEKSGVSFVTCRAKRAPGSNPRGGVIASAHELANWLKTKPFSGISWDGLWSDYERSDKTLFWHIP